MAGGYDSQPDAEEQAWLDEQLHNVDMNAIEERLGGTSVRRQITGSRFERPPLRCIVCNFECNLENEGTFRCQGRGCSNAVCDDCSESGQGVGSFSVMTCAKCH